MAWDDVLVAYVSKYTAAIHNEMVTQIKARILHSLDTEANGVLVGTGAGAFIFKTLAQFKTILGLGDAAYKNTGSSTGTLCAGDDSRLSNARTPTAHKSTHATGQSDALSASDISAEPANANIQSHISSTSNPHGVTAAQLGLSNVDNVQQMPASYLDTDATFAANSDSKVPSQKSVKTAALNWVPKLRSFFTPTYLYSSDGVEKPLKCNAGYHVQISLASNGDYFIIPVYCAGGETILELSYYKASDKGIVDLYISNDGITYNLDSAGYDFYSAASIPSHSSITLTQGIAAGWNYIKIVLNGKNPSTNYYYCGIYGVRLR